MDFSDAETSSPAQELTLSSQDVKGEKLELRFVRFQNVRSLHILVKSNQENDETTRIDSIDIFGTGMCLRDNSSSCPAHFTVGDATDKGPLPKHDHEH